MPQLNTGDYVVIQPSDGSGDIRLDATEIYDVGASAKLSTRPVDNNTSVSDHYQVQNEVISFSGVIVNSNDYSTASEQSPFEYVQRIKSLMKDAVLCRLILPESPQIENCTVTTFGYSKSKDIGSGLNVNLGFTQIILANRAEGILAVPRTSKQNKAQDQTNDGATKKREAVGGFSNLTGTNLVKAPYGG